MPNKDKADWIEWQRKANLHGSSRTSDDLRKLLDARFYRLTVTQRWKQAKQARAWLAQAETDDLPPAVAHPKVQQPQHPENKDGERREEDAENQDSKVEGHRSRDNQERLREQGQQKGQNENDEKPGAKATPTPSSSGDKAVPAKPRLRRARKAKQEVWYGPIEHSGKKRRGSGQEKPASRDDDEPTPKAGKLKNGIQGGIGKQKPNSANRGLMKESKFTPLQLARKRIWWAARVSPPDFTAMGWTGGWDTGTFLGGGGFGAAFIFREWVNNAVVDRIVMKDTHVPDRMWESFAFWGCDPTTTQKPKPNEIRCMKAVGGSPDHRLCARIIAEEVRLDEQFYRIFMEYCPHGSLYDVVDLHTENESNVPEPAVWSLFSDLVDACLVLQYGAVTEHDAEEVENWRPIVHRDLNPGNVWLDSRELDPRFPSYPKARIGDFGLSVRTDENDAMNPLAYAGNMGTPGFTAPEQMSYLKVPGYVKHKGPQLSEKTNIWGIGATIMRLMNREMVFNEALFDDGTPDSPKFNKYGKQFSKTLRDLVETCVGYKPEDRPTLRNLQVSIVSATSKGDGEDADEGKVLAENMRYHKRRRDQPHLKLRVQEDKYKLGMASEKYPPDKTAGTGGDTKNVADPVVVE